jgi:hypothetical protein
MKRNGFAFGGLLGILMVLLLIGLEVAYYFKTSPMGGGFMGNDDMTVEEGVELMGLDEDFEMMIAE